MSSGDILSVAAGVGIVILIACVVHPGWLAFPAAPGSAPDIGASGNTPVPTPPLPVVTPPLPSVSRDIQKLTYVRNPSVTYQIYLLPDTMSTFGASDPPWQSSNISTFASLEASSGGATETFTVPYPVWRINCTMYKGDRPGNAYLGVLLVDAEENTIVDGAEVLGPGTIIKNIEVSGKAFYLIVKTQTRDGFRVSLETRSQYLQ